MMMIFHIGGKRLKYFARYVSSHMLRYKCLQPFWVAKKNSLGNSRTKCYKNVKGFICKQSNFLPFHITSERPSNRFFGTVGITIPPKQVIELFG